MSELPTLQEAFNQIHTTQLYQHAGSLPILKGDHFFKRGKKWLDSTCAVTGA